MAHAYHAEFGLPTVSVRPFNIFGPGQIGGGAIRAFIEAALDGRDLTIHGDGAQIRAWCYVDDMVDGTLARARASERGRRELQHRQRALRGDDLRPRAADQAAHRRARARSSSSRSTTSDVELRIPNIGKARELLGFEAKVELDEGLERTIEWYRENAGRSA